MPDADLSGGGTLTVIVVCTVVMSTLLHGLTANPLVTRFARAPPRQEWVV